MNAEIDKAVRRDRAETLREWLDAGGDARTYAEGDSLLSIAARHGAARCAALLLERDASPNDAGDWPSALVHAVEAGAAEIVDMLLAAGADVGAYEYHEDADLPLLSAVHGGRWPIAQRLLQAGAAEKADPRWFADVLDDALAQRGKGKPGFVAELLERLLARFPSAPLPVDDRQLDAAVKLLRPDATRRDLASRIAARVDQERAAAENLVHLLVEEERPDDALAALQADPAAERRARLAAILLPWAALEDYTELVEALLQLAGSDVDRHDGHGRTALMYAAWHGDLALAECLLALGADPRRESTKELEIALDWTARGLDSEAVRRLLLERLAASAPPLDAAADARIGALAGEDQRAAAAQAAIGAAAEGRWERAEGLLAQHDLPVDARGARGRTLLMVAAAQADPQRMRWLLERGADRHARDERRRGVDGYALGDEVVVLLRAVDLRDKPVVKARIEGHAPCTARVGAVKDFVIEFAEVPAAWPHVYRGALHVASAGGSFDWSVQLAWRTATDISLMFVPPLDERRLAELRAVVAADTPPAA